MKQFVCLVYVLGIALQTYSQAVPLAITTNKTTSLVFPFPIKHADRGTKDILVQIVKEADNILLVKAAAADFPETNLSVITGDGHLHAFLVNYVKTSPTLVYQVPNGSAYSVKTVANSLLDTPQTTHYAQSQKWGVQIAVSGIYIQDSAIYCQLRLTNKSPIDYDVDAWHFSIRDRKQIKRTAVQEVEIIPQYTAGKMLQVKAGVCKTMVVVLEKFTIPDRKAFYIEVFERNGGRHMRLKVGNRHLLRTRPLG